MNIILPSFKTLDDDPESQFSHQEIKDLKIRYISDSRQRSIFLLLEKEDFGKDVRKMAKALSLTTDEVFMALENLKKLNFVEETESGVFRKKIKSIQLQTSEFTDSEKKKAQAMLFVDFLTQRNSDPLGSIRSSFVFCNQETLEEFQKELKDVFNKFLERSKKDDSCDTLLNFHFLLDKKSI